MKQGWETKKLGDFFEITSSKRVFQSDWRRSGVPFYRAREIVKLAQQGFVDNELFISEDMYKQYSEKYGIPKEGDLMVTGVGTLGICYVVKKDDRFYFKDGNILWFKKNNDINSRFVEYAFKSEFLRKQIDDAVGATVGTFTIVKAKSTLIPVPPLEEQQRIVALLDETFAALNTVHANAEQNQDNAGELFDAVSRDIFEKSNNGWQEAKLGDVCEFTRGPFGGHLKKNIFRKNGYAVYEQRHAIHKNFAEVRYYIDENKFSEMKRFELHPGELIMSCSGVTLGRVSIAPPDMQPGIINQALLKLSPIKGKISAEFLKLWMESESFQVSIKKYSQGAAIPNVASVKILKDIPIRLPSIQEQQAIVGEIKALAQETRRLEEVYQCKVDAVEELRKSILQKAFEGGL